MKAQAIVLIPFRGFFSPLKDLIFQEINDKKTSLKTTIARDCLHH
ncbi:MAG: hypothetical protein V1726_08585 [Methanobacteriota archaeon]